MDLQTDVRVDDWPTASKTIETAVYERAVKLRNESKRAEADRLIASWNRIMRG